MATDFFNRGGGSAGAGGATNAAGGGFLSMFQQPNEDSNKTGGRTLDPHGADFPKLGGGGGGFGGGGGGLKSSAGDFPALNASTSLAEALRAQQQQQQQQQQHLAGVMDVQQQQHQQQVVGGNANMFGASSGRTGTSSTQQQQQQQRRLSGGSSASATGTSNGGNASTSSAPALGGEHGLLSLLRLVCMSDADRASLALSIPDPTLVGMTVTSAEQLYALFATTDDSGYSNHAAMISSPATNAAAVGVGMSPSTAVVGSITTGTAPSASTSESGATGAPGTSASTTTTSTANSNNTTAANNNNNSTNNTPGTEPRFHLPMCYYMNPPALKTGHLSKFQLETLFYMFYAMPRDVLQAYAAQELYAREWWYHKDHALWFQLRKEGNKKEGGNQNDASKNGDASYIYFDVSSWERRLFTGVLPAGASGGASGSGSGAAATAGTTTTVSNLVSGFLSKEEVRVKFSHGAGSGGSSNHASS